MRFMMIVKADASTEAGVLPTEQQLADMARYNEELAKAGVMLAGEGLQASSKGARVRYSGKHRTVIDGPFTESKELIAGFWLIRVDSRDEAIEWAKRVPFEDGEVEIRQVFELEDFGSSEAVDRHAQLRAQLEQKRTAAT
ncbi:MAG TPA: YciI family protein [Longimicrobiales bacterium]